MQPEGNSRRPIQSAREDLEVGNRGWLVRLKEDQHSQWLQNPLGPSVPKEGNHVPKTYIDNRQREALEETKGQGEPPAGAQ